jgi:hypothetical protein
MHKPFFAGRSTQLAAFTGVLEPCADASPAILYVHGPAGIGKTALLRRFADFAGAADRRVVPIDAAGSAPELAARVRAAVAGGGAVLLLDDVDRVPGAGDVLPAALGEDTVVVVAGRHAPGLGWRTAARRRRPAGPAARPAAPRRLLRRRRRSGWACR